MIAYQPGRQDGETDDRQDGRKHSRKTDQSEGRVGVTVPGRAALLADLEARLRAGAGFAVATLNLDHVVKLRRDPAFRAAYARQTHVTADGNPIVWLHRLAGRPVELVQGADLVEPIAACAARAGVPVALLGATPETLAAAATALQAASPGLRIAARIAPPYGFDPAGAAAEACLAELAEKRIGLCFLALGAPKQEILAARGLDRVPGCGFVSIGAGLDFIAGTQRRAPRWVQNIAMEWAWRMLTDPRRLARRYLDCALVLPGLARDAVEARRGGA